MKLLSLVTGLALATVWLTPLPAWACTCSVAPIYFADPQDGAHDVAPNVALLIAGALRPESIALRDADGNAVPFALTAGPTAYCPGTSAELLPAQPLRPNTTYEVSVLGTYPDGGKNKITFTTGTAFLPEQEPSVPQGVASVVLGAPAPLCGSGSIRACVGVEEHRNVELIARRGERVLFHGLMSANDVDFTLPEQPDCIELRGRTPTGRRSAPLTICGEALVARAHVSSSYPPALTCHAGEFVDALPASGAIDAGSSSADAAAPDAAEAAHDGGASSGDAGHEAGATVPPVFGARVPEEGGCSLESNRKAPPLAIVALALALGLARRRRRR